MSLLKGRSKARAAPAPAPAHPVERQDSSVAAAPPTLWIDKYAPATSKDLAVHKKKVDEVRGWLQTVDASLQLGLPPVPRLLILSGPPGTGKSAMLRVLAAEHGYETCEWVEPRSTRGIPGGGGGGGGGSSYDSWEGGARVGGKQLDARAVPFATFLRESLRTLSLCVVPSAASGGGAASSSSSSQGIRRRLVVVDELAAPAAKPVRGEESLLEQQQALIRQSLPSARYPMVLVLSSDSGTTVRARRAPSRSPARPPARPPARVCPRVQPAPVAPPRSPPPPRRLRSTPSSRSS